ncbi:MAG: 16S rRNA (guanine(527)-N(7))-methyltransferase RsmG [Elusimicrobia bacterium GWA2_61_42]|nr:MAG: 16S rRNA (guanine(527)-N(7))-methyltransferase RsmG [Elusimicrobia bacterium GWA2_61_42]OGR74135.1 MAG: 16S rRNA (guanine(527)-N(7))-methyltransferase RsmG [Elusimicrobia bacterium GWC2_61_25]
MNDAVTKTLEAWGLKLTEENLRKLEAFSAGLKEKNAVQNLVSEKDIPQLWERHMLDSLAAAGVLRRRLKPGALIADAGSGAGFPGLALAAALEEFNFQLLDSRVRRCDFLGETAAAMGTRNVAVFNRRVGEGGPGSEARYAAVTERAMGQLENILPQCLNILVRGGIFLAWQSAAQLAQPRPAVEAARRKAGAELAETVTYRLPGESEDRYILVFQKSR